MNVPHIALPVLTPEQVQYALYASLGLHAFTLLALVKLWATVGKLLDRARRGL